jgi:molybdate transport system substrate-binding protein
MIAATADLYVIATGAFEHVLNELVGPFKAETGRAVRLSVANAAGVIRKLQADEPADVVMTSAAGIDALAAQGRIKPATAVEVGRMRLGVAIGAAADRPDLRTADDLRAALRAAAAIAYIDPKGGGTSGPFFIKLFERLGMSDDMATKGVLCATGRDVVRAVASGRAALGLTQASELIGANGVQFAGYLSADLQVVSVYSAAVAANVRSPGGAEDFIRFVTGPRGAERFRSSGWDVG